MTATLVLPDPPLRDGAITLRAFTHDDVPWVVKACQDPEISRFTAVPKPYQESHASEWIATHADAREQGEALALAIVEGDQPLGSISLLRIDWTQLRGEIGYWVAPWGRGRGAATRAVRLLAAHGFERCGLQRIEVIPYTDNPASQRVAEKCGAQREGVLRSYFLAAGERHDCVMYALLPDDVRGAPA
jgi:RimJ/RimL family protein N-acetyltransferase